MPNKCYNMKTVILFKSHVSCATKSDGDCTTTATKNNEVSQVELKNKLAAADKDSIVLKLYEDIKCSVCLNNYKEILDEDNHIVILSCGHPLCCKCADNILKIEKKECPQCRGKITAKSFNLMKFNADL